MPFSEIGLPKKFFKNLTFFVTLPKQVAAFLTFLIFDKFFTNVFINFRQITPFAFAFVFFLFLMN